MVKIAYSTNTRLKIIVMVVHTMINLVLGRYFRIRYEHINDVRLNNDKLRYALHIL
jgi:hypothetical protein